LECQIYLLFLEKSKNFARRNKTTLGERDHALLQDGAGPVMSGKLLVIQNKGVAGAAQKR
jgi:hypothetical protein